MVRGIHEMPAVAHLTNVSLSIKDGVIFTMPRRPVQCRL